MNNLDPSERTICGVCGAVALQSTFAECGGLCMQCFMKRNYGYRPSELASLRARGLEHYFERWRRFENKRIPFSWFHAPDPKTTHYVPLIQASISGYLRFGEGNFDAGPNIKFLVELKLSSKGKLNAYILELEELVQDLTDLTKEYTPKTAEREG